MKMFRILLAMLTAFALTAGSMTSCGLLASLNESNNTDQSDEPAPPPTEDLSPAGLFDSLSRIDSAQIEVIYFEPTCNTKLIIQKNNGRIAVEFKQDLLHPTGGVTFTSETYYDLDRALIYYHDENGTWYTESLDSTVTWEALLWEHLLGIEQFYGTSEQMIPFVDEHYTFANGTYTASTAALEMITTEDTAKSLTMTYSEGIYTFSYLFERIIYEVGAVDIEGRVEIGFSEPKIYFPDEERPDEDPYM